MAEEKDLYATNEFFVVYDNGKKDSVMSQLGEMHGVDIIGSYKYVSAIHVRSSEEEVGKVFSLESVLALEKVKIVEKK